jgi:hypothetical protein
MGKAVATVFVDEKSRGEELECDGALELCVFGSVNYTHAAFTKLFDNSIV